MTDEELQAVKRRHEAALDSAYSSHADRGVLLAEVLRLRAQRALENEDLTRAFDMGRDKGQEHERSVVHFSLLTPRFPTTSRASTTWTPRQSPRAS